MTRFKKPKNFYLPESPEKKGGRGVKWLFLLLFVFLLAGTWAFFQYGISYLASFSSLFNSLDGEETTNAAKDKIPPAPPVIEPLPEATNSAVLDVVGRAEPSSELSLFLNGEEIKKIVINNEGSFMVSQISLAEGNNNVFAFTKDAAGNISQESVRQIIILDKEPPTLEIESPKDGQSFSGNDAEIIVKGKTEEDAVVTINERKVVVDLDGYFEATYSLSDGENAIMILAKDMAGNQTKEELGVSYRP